MPSRRPNTFKLYETNSSPGFDSRGFLGLALPLVPGAFGQSGGQSLWRFCFKNSPRLCHRSSGSFDRPVCLGRRPAQFRLVPLASVPGNAWNQRSCVHRSDSVHHGGSHVGESLGERHFLYAVRSARLEPGQRRFPWRFSVGIFRIYRFEPFPKRKASGRFPRD